MGSIEFLVDVGFQSSVTRLGDFLKFLATNLFTKVTQKCLLLGYFDKDQLMWKLLWIFLGNSWKHLGNFLPQQLVTLVLTANSDGEKINIIMSRAKAMAFGTPFLSLS